MTPCLLKRYILEEPALLLVSGLHGNILLLTSLHESPFYHSALFLSHWKPKSITEAISICSPNLLVCHFYQRGQPGCLRNISLRPPPGADYLIPHLAQQSISDFSQDLVANTCFVSQDSSCSTSPASSASQSSWRSRQLNFRTVWHARLGTQRRRIVQPRWASGRPPEGRRQGHCGQAQPRGRPWLIGECRPWACWRVWRQRLGQLRLERWWGARPRDCMSPCEECRYSGDRGCGRNPRSFYLLLLCFPESYQERGFCRCQTRFLTGYGGLRTLNFLKL